MKVSRVNDYYPSEIAYPALPYGWETMYREFIFPVGYAGDFYPWDYDWEVTL